VEATRQPITVPADFSGSVLASRGGSTFVSVKAVDISVWVAGFPVLYR